MLIFEIMRTDKGVLLITIVVETTLQMCKLNAKQDVLCLC